MPDASPAERTSGAGKTPPLGGWRLYLGLALIGLSLVGPITVIPLLTSLGLSSTAIASISGMVLIGAEVLLVAAVAIMGKEGFAHIKNRAFAFLKRHRPPQRVSRPRYLIGLVLFVLPLLFGWLAPYLGNFIPGLQGHEIEWAMAGDGLLLVSLFVLGGDFWDKLRALFIHDARAVFP